LLNSNKLTIGARESDSHYRMKYTHVQSERIAPPQRHHIPPRIQARIEEAYAWYYQMYYPPRPPG
jgi:sulfotransferase